MVCGISDAEIRQKSAKHREKRSIAGTDFDEGCFEWYLDSQFVVWYRISDNDDHPSYHHSSRAFDFRLPFSMENSDLRKLLFALCS